MPYGILKCDTITFTDGGVDKSVAISGLVQNPTFSGNITVTGTISGNAIQGQTVSGVTVLSTTGTFTSLTGTTTSGTTANFVSGVFSTQISGATVTGGIGSFTTITGGTVTLTSGVFALGTNALPSISFSSDPNTGIYSPDADQVAVATNGTGRLFVDSSGNVGVGISPSAIFEAAGSEPVFGLNHHVTQYLTSTKAYNATPGGGIALRYKYNSANDYTYGAGISFEKDNTVDGDFGSHITLQTRPNAGSATERLRITSAGLVGVGTSSPGYALDVLAGSGSAVTARFRGNGGANNNTQIRFYGNNAATDQWAIGGSVATSDTGRDFHIYDLVANANRFAINSSGNVGIGTTSPSSPLTIESSAGNQIKITYPSIASYFLNATSGGDFAINKDGTERARIDSSGRLLVGTSSTSKQTRALIQGNSGGGATAEVILAADTSTPSGGLGNIYFTDNAHNTAAIIAGVRDGGTWTSGSSHPISLQFYTTADGASSPTERMRITNNGFLKASNNANFVASSTHYLNTNLENAWALTVDSSRSSGNVNGILVNFSGYSPNNTSQIFLICTDTTADRVQLRSNGGIANFQANNVNLSDINTKKDISPAAGTWDCIKEWEIVNYRYKDQPDDADLNLGVIAQQVAESCPEVITVFQEAKEATDDQPAQEERLGVKEQQMYWMAIKALQEAQVRIEVLETEVAALKAQ